MHQSIGAIAVAMAIAGMCGPSAAQTPELRFNSWVQGEGLADLKPVVGKSIADVKEKRGLDGAGILKFPRATAASHKP